MENKTYDILELQKMSTIDLASLAETLNLSIQNNFKQSLIYAILDKQASTLRPTQGGADSVNRRPSELHARDRYALVLILVSALLFFASCATQSPKSASLHRAVNQFQECAQYQARRSAGKDPGRMYRNHDRQPHRMTRIPLTNLYIF